MDRVELRAGPLTGTLEDGALRWLSIADEELIRGVYAAVRDRSWGTIPPRFMTYDVLAAADSFHVRISAECVRESDGIDLAWTAELDGGRDGVVRIAFDGVARRAFLKARLGLCVLHPSRLANRSVEVRTTSGVHRAKFPDLIAPAPPFTNVTSIRQEPGTRREVRLDFEGELFEMEDQRNWTDASFKTYSTPTSLPWPVRLQAGDVVHQVLVITPTPARRATSTAAGGRSRAGRAPAATRADTIEVAATTAGAMPAIGTCAAPPDVALTAEILAAARTLRLSHLRETLNVGDAAVEHRLSAVLQQASDVGAGVEIGIVARRGDPSIESLVRVLATTKVPVARLLVFDPESHSSPRGLLESVREVAMRVGLRAPIGGGSRGYFEHLNIDRPPGNLIDVVAYPINPQVHAFDDTTIMENLIALSATVRTARALTGCEVVAIGPATLAPLFNPDVVGPDEPVPPGTLPRRYDRRQDTLFAAAWTVGCVAALAAADVASLTLHELAGSGGLLSASQKDMPVSAVPTGRPYPVFHVLEALGGSGGKPLLATSSSDEVAVIAAANAGASVVLIANLRPTPTTVELAGSGIAGPTNVAARMLAGRLGSDGTESGWRQAHLSQTKPRTLSIELEGYGVARLDREPPG